MSSPDPPDTPTGRAGIPTECAPEGRLILLPEGRHLGVRTWPGTGPPVVLLHGMLDSSAGWDRLARSLGRKCIAFDLPGFGRSDRASRARISAFAADVAAALEILEIDRFVLVGHSVGGAVATAIAEMLPERVLALVLLAPAGFGRIHLAEAISIPGIRNLAAVILPVALANPVVLSAAYTGVVTAGQRPERAMLARTMRRAFDSVDGARDATAAVVAAGRSRRAFYRRGVAYDGPVTAVWGEHDHLVPVAHAAGVRAALPQAVIEIWPGMGHHPQQERPDALTALVEGALRDAPTAARAIRSRAA